VAVAAELLPDPNDPRLEVDILPHQPDAALLALGTRGDRFGDLADLRELLPELP
jgi:hypothetical protein